MSGDDDKLEWANQTAPCIRESGADTRLRLMPALDFRRVIFTPSLSLRFGDVELVHQTQVSEPTPSSYYTSHEVEDPHDQLHLTIVVLCSFSHSVCSFTMLDPSDPYQPMGAN